MMEFFHKTAIRSTPKILWETFTSIEVTRWDLIKRYGNCLNIFVYHIKFLREPQRKTKNHNKETSNKSFQSMYNISHKLLRPSQFLEKFVKILEWSTLQK